MTTQSLSAYRKLIQNHNQADEYQVVDELIKSIGMSQAERQAISIKSLELIEQVRNDSKPSMMEKFLAEYGLTTKEGVALMCLAEALLRVPDSQTIDTLIQDKVVPGEWQDHLGQANSKLINSATWGLLLTGKIIAPVDSESMLSQIRHLVKKLGEPMVRMAVAQTMKELGRQFVLGRNINEAMQNARSLEKKGYTYSYDMLGEAARTQKDAQKYFDAYSNGIAAISSLSLASDIRQNPGISVKLSALHPRYEVSQRLRVMQELVPRTVALAEKAKQGNMGFNIDAEEADRLDLSLDVIEAVLAKEELAGWDGFGVVVQAYSPRAPFVLDWLYALAKSLDRRIMVRLVKGAYWDAEIKRAQILGLEEFPVFTRKANSDVSYIACAKKLMAMRDRIYPQFATHNAHSIAAVLELSDDLDSFEFQRLQGMGESLHQAVVSNEGAHCRVYAPVGAHQDLLAYLVRRLLENGANSSFVNQIVDKTIPPASIAEDPISKVLALGSQVSSSVIFKPQNLFSGQRLNSRGWDISDPETLKNLNVNMAEFKSCQWNARPIIDAPITETEQLNVVNPADLQDRVGSVQVASVSDIAQAIQVAKSQDNSWYSTSSGERAAVLNRVGQIFEENAEELFALLIREAGKSINDAISELREAVDFAYFYAEQAISPEQENAGLGVVTCISPWNFPLAIFSGQILASLAAGNVVLAKPADQTPLVAYRATQLMHQAGVPVSALQLLPGSGIKVGAPLTSDAQVNAVCFTGSTLTAQTINRSMANNLAADAPLIAETGGLNAMIVDSTALPEQVVRDVLASAFQSAGQRCSALRMLYIQEDIAEHLMEMLFGAMDELSIGNTWDIKNDIGPVIDSAAKAKIMAHCEYHRKLGNLVKELTLPKIGNFVAPTVIRVAGISALEEEIFGPVLHIATYQANEIEQVVDQINAKGYGLTFGLHTRIDGRINQVIGRIKAGNSYVNRNQIGAVVGSQPFGGEGLSGTGPKAGGPHYVNRLRKSSEAPFNDNFKSTLTINVTSIQTTIDQLDKSTQQDWLENSDRISRLSALYAGCKYWSLKNLISEEIMPGPTGELNRLSCVPRGTILSIGQGEAYIKQIVGALSQGNAVVALVNHPEDLNTLSTLAVDDVPLNLVSGQIDLNDLEKLKDVQALSCHAPTDIVRACRKALSLRDGALIPLVTEVDQLERFVIERHLCMDTTAAGGNASLIAISE